VHFLFLLSPVFCSTSKFLFRFIGLFACIAVFPMIITPVFSIGLELVPYVCLLYEDDIIGLFSLWCFNFCLIFVEFIYIGRFKLGRGCCLVFIVFNRFELHHLPFLFMGGM